MDLSAGFGLARHNVSRHEIPEKKHSPVLYIEEHVCIYYRRRTIMYMYSYCNIATYVLVWRHYTCAHVDISLNIYIYIYAFLFKVSSIIAFFHRALL